jgi:hypothetical protein
MRKKLIPTSMGVAHHLGRLKPGIQTLGLSRREYRFAQPFCASFGVWNRFSTPTCNPDEFVQVRS